MGKHGPLVPELALLVCCPLNPPGRPTCGRRCLYRRFEKLNLTPGVSWTPAVPRGVGYWALNSTCRNPLHKHEGTHCAEKSTQDTRAVLSE